jgi:hypothetical protein
VIWVGLTSSVRTSKKTTRLPTIRVATTHTTVGRRFAFPTYGIAALLPLPLPGKRKLELLHESVGHVVAEHAVFFWPELIAFHCGAEQVVEEGEVS